MEFCVKTSTPDSVLPLGVIQSILNTYQKKFVKKGETNDAQVCLTLTKIKTAVKQNKPFKSRFKYLRHRNNVKSPSDRKLFKGRFPTETEISEDYAQTQSPTKRMRSPQKRASPYKEKQLNNEAVKKQFDKIFKLRPPASPQKEKQMDNSVGKRTYKKTLHIRPGSSQRKLHDVIKL